MKEQGFNQGSRAMPETEIFKELANFRPAL
jgi:hypothetical protein